MSTRAALIAACTAARDYDNWAAATKALGQWVRAGRPEPPTQGRKTGENPVALIERVTQSRVFNEDRDQLRADARYGNPNTLAALVDYVLREAKERKQTHRHLYQIAP